MITSYEVRQKNPLIHCITNIVVANFQANGLLAMGASPIMADAPEEASDIARIANAVVLNIGTLNQRTVDAMVLAGKTANQLNIPVVFDPVGAGASPYRLTTTRRLLKEINMSVIRCNAGELAAIAGVEWQAKGVDAGAGQADVTAMAKHVASTFNTIVAVTGEKDIVTDGLQTAAILGGDARLTQITGAGCLLSAVVAAFYCTRPSMEAVISAMTFYKRVGEQAVQGTFGDIVSHLMTALFELSQEDEHERNTHNSRF